MTERMEVTLTKLLTATVESINNVCRPQIEESKKITDDFLNSTNNIIEQQQERERRFLMFDRVKQILFYGSCAGNLIALIIIFCFLFSKK
jgi:hypothetical protein